MIAPPEVCVRVKVVFVSVALVIASEKVADTEELRATPVAASAGEMDETVGGVVSGTGPVVKLQVKSAASGLPAESSTPVVMVAVCCASAARGPEGVKVTELLVAVTVPATGKPPWVSWKVLAFKVAFSMTSEKVAVMAEFAAMPIAALAGEVDETAGGVVSAPSVEAATAFEIPERFPAAS